MWFDHLAFWWKLRRLQRQEEKIQRGFQSDLDKARAERDRDKEQEVVTLILFETGLARDEIRQLQHQYVTRQAQLLLLPVPKYSQDSEFWFRSRDDGDWTLTPEALARLAREVRQERRERLELVLLWPSAIIGLVGGLAGIWAVFSK